MTENNKIYKKAAGYDDVVFLWRNIPGEQDTIVENRVPISIHERNAMSERGKRAAMHDVLEPVVASAAEHTEHFVSAVSRHACDVIKHVDDAERTAFMFGIRKDGIDDYRNIMRKVQDSDTYAFKDYEEIFLIVVREGKAVLKRKRFFERGLVKTVQADITFEICVKDVTVRMHANETVESALAKIPKDALLFLFEDNVKNARVSGVDIKSVEEDD